MRAIFGPLFRPKPAAATEAEYRLWTTLRAARTRVEFCEADLSLVRRIGFAAWLIHRGRLSEDLQEVQP